MDQLLRFFELVGPAFLNGIELFLVHQLPSWNVRIGKGCLVYFKRVQHVGVDVANDAFEIRYWLGKCFSVEFYHRQD